MNTSPTETSAAPPVVRKRGLVCNFMPTPFQNHTHPLMVGMFRWLKARTAAVLADPTIPWNGVWQDYHWLKEGKNLEPSPKEYLTPDNPESFEPSLLDRKNIEDNPDIYSEDYMDDDIGNNPDGFDLEDLERELGSVDSLAWFDMEVAKKVTPTKELYAKLVRGSLERRLDQFTRRGQDSVESAVGSSLVRTPPTQAATSVEPA